jgi:hypothetical protein
MKMQHISLLVSACLIGSTSVMCGADFGNAADVKEVRKVVAAKFGHPLHASVSHDWALCTAYTDHSDLSVVLRRIAPNKWKVMQSDGGAFVAENLEPLGVPEADIPALLKAYQ